jgi:hypothetical protein
MREIRHREAANRDDREPMPRLDLGMGLSHRRHVMGIRTGNPPSNTLAKRIQRLANLIQIQQQQAYASQARTAWERPANGDPRGIKVHVINPGPGHGNLVHLITRGTNYVSIHKVTEEIFAVSPDGRKVLNPCGTLSTINQWDWGGPKPAPARSRPRPNGTVDPRGNPRDTAEP